ncbi:hypothetical protein C0214_19955 [Methylobacterium sp. DM1]|nr:hypothetical protein C0214_19955 [Methylobacterium sp. DM1]
MTVSHPTETRAPAAKAVKALSIMQPWAWLIVNGHKDIENRDWRGHFRGPALSSTATAQRRTDRA